MFALQKLLSGNYDTHFVKDHYTPKDKRKTKSHAAMADSCTNRMTSKNHATIN
jgi:hypothetical protein